MSPGGGETDSGFQMGQQPCEQLGIRNAPAAGFVGMEAQDVLGLQPDESVAVWVAKVLKRPVKWRSVGGCWTSLSPRRSLRRAATSEITSTT